MKKVLHIINGEFFAGAERVQDLLALRLPEFGYECGFVCLKEGVFGKYRRSQTPLHVVQMHSRFDFSIVGRIAQIVSEGGYSAIHTHTARSALIGRFVARKLRLPFIHHVHSPAGRDTESRVRNVVNSVMEDHFIFPSASRLIAVSSSLKQYLLQKKVPDSKIAVVTNGVPIYGDHPAWHAPQSRWIVGTVALFRPRKGVEVLLQAVRQLVDSGEDVCFKGVGSFETVEYEVQVKKLVEDLNLQDRVHWTGFTSNVHAEMESMHAFVLPSLFGEGLPMVVIEAMSVGIPVAASNVEGIPEVICSEDYGAIIEPNNADALEAGIKKLIANAGKIPAMVLSAHTRQREYFSDISMAKGVAKNYDEVIN